MTKNIIQHSFFYLIKCPGKRYFEECQHSLFMANHIYEQTKPFAYYREVQGINSTCTSTKDSQSNNRFPESMIPQINKAGKMKEIELY